MTSLTPPRATGAGALAILSFAWGGCGYSDFRLPELAPAEPQIRYEWEPRAVPVYRMAGPASGIRMMP